LFLSRFGYLYYLRDAKETFIIYKKIDIRLFNYIVTTYNALLNLYTMKSLAQTQPMNPTKPSITYSLQNFADIAASGFNYAIAETVLLLINKLSSEVGSPTYVKTPVFQKKMHHDTTGHGASSKEDSRSSGGGKKRVPSGGKEEEDWTTIRSFQATKIEKKEGIDGLINKMQLILNKVTDKNKEDSIRAISDILNELVDSGATVEDMSKVGATVFAIASTNRFYSKLYADIYANLIENYEMLKDAFQTSFNAFEGLFQSIQCGDPDKNYNEYCDFVKINEQRRALSLFFVNLCKNGVLSSETLLKTLCTLVLQMDTLMKIPDKTNEVSELSEIIGIIYSEDLMHITSDCLIEGVTIKQWIVKVSKSAPKTYLSFPSKAKFKLMDMADAMM